MLPSETRTDYNVIAEKRGINNDNVVMKLGPTSTAWQAGPGINDNGSGSAALLETALQMAKVKPVNTVRYAWWGAEESGLLGSTAYVAGALTGREGPHRALPQLRHGGLAQLHLHDVRRQRDVLPGARRGADPGRVRGDRGTCSSASTPRWVSLMTMSVFSGRSDYHHFIQGGIPAWWRLFTGAETVKTAEQAGIWGGTGGAQFDPCYHSACDTLGNVDLHALDVNSDLIAYAALTYAYSTESVNGVAGQAGA